MCVMYVCMGCEGMLLVWCTSSMYVSCWCVCCGNGLHFVCCASVYVVTDVYFVCGNGLCLFQGIVVILCLKVHISSCYILTYEISVCSDIQHILGDNFVVSKLCGHRSLHTKP